MTPYKNQDGDSGIDAYELATADSIIIRFRKGGTYLYDSDRPGLDHVHRMTELAVSGAGLGTYINRHVRDNYAKKLG